LDVLFHDFVEVNKAYVKKSRKTDSFSHAAFVIKVTACFDVLWFEK
jgi:hypothetical protein